MTAEFTIAVHSLVMLHHAKRIVSSDELAKNVCTNPVRVRRIMARLRKANLIEAREGVRGGYYFPGDAEQTTLRQVLDAVSAPLVYSNWRSGSPDLGCLISSGMAQVMDDLFEELDMMCRCQLEKVTLSDISKKIFKEKKLGMCIADKSTEKE